MREKRPTSPPSTRERGNKAELVAAEHLKKIGYRIVETNFSCRLGEIDIIARHEGHLVFVEVRSRKSTSIPDPVYSVNHRKRQRIIHAATLYLARHFTTPPASRFDVVLVTLTTPPVVEVIADAFWA